MNMFKKIGLGIAALGFGLMLTIPTADARQFGYKIDGATVDDVTTTVCTTGPNQNVSGFGNGVSMNQVWDLQKEVGSPGSGAWVNVGGFTDVFPTTNGAAAVGGITQIMRYSSPEKACYRLRMSTDTAGTAQVQLVADGDSPTAASSLTTSTHTRRFDDFNTGLLPITTGHVADSSYLAFIGGGSSAVVFVVEGDQEGLITGSSGSTDNDTDASVISYGLLAHGSLISSGLTVFETRLTLDSAVTLWGINVGLGDIIQTSGEEPMFECNTNVCAQLPSDDFNNAVAFLYHTDSNDAQGDFWLAANENADTMGNAADEYSLGNTPVASTYQVLRLEIDSSGHAFYYINGSLMGVEPLAVATTAVLIPTVTLNSPDDGTAAVRKVYIDYFDFYTPRPAARP